jgi:hypothetical protein
MVGGAGYSPGMEDVYKLTRRAKNATIKEMTFNIIQKGYF